MYSQTFWINACVKTIMDEVSSLDWDIVPKEGYSYAEVEGAIQEVKEFLLHPNANSQSFGQIIRAWLKDTLEIDAACIVKTFDIGSYDFDQMEPKSGAPMLKPIGQRRMVEIGVYDGASFLKEIDKFGFEKGYWQYSYQIPAHPMWFNFEEISYSVEHPRSMSCYGFARTQAILDIVKSLHYSTLWNKKFFEESAIPDGALSMKDTSPQELIDFRNYWNGEFRAQPHKVAIINKEINFQPFGGTNVELQFLDTQKWDFNIAISAFGLTPSELGITDDLNRATSATQAELVKRKGIRPFLKLFENVVNLDILPEFQHEGIEFQFIYDDPAEKAAKLANWNMELNMGVKTPNEVRNEMGLEPIDGGDITNTQANRIMMQQQAPGEEKPGESGKKPESGKDPAEQGKDSAEEGQSSGYKDTLQREESDHKKEKAPRNDEDERRAAIMRPYGPASRPVANMKGHVATSGQYYNDQPITQPRKPSGAMYQPQNARSAAQFTDTDPSPLGSDYRRPGIDTYKEDPVKCPMCGFATLASINPEETTLGADIRCTQCGARFTEKDIITAHELERMHNIMTAPNAVDPISIYRYPSGLSTMTKSADDMTCKDFCGFDIGKSMPQAISYAASEEYFKLLKKYLPEFSDNGIRTIIKTIVSSLAVGKTIRDIARTLNGMGIPEDQAQRIARTEVVRLGNEGNLNMMEEKGTETVEFISAPEDGRLCKDCAAHDRKVYKVQEAKGMLPLHVNCRCMFTEHYE
jgi:SPP1 gp7 family putative phage head morphogenesis protein